MKIIPCGRRVIIKEIVEQEKPPVFVVPEKWKDQKTVFNGTVMESGDLEKISLDKGQEVLFHKHSPEIVEYQGQMCLLVNEGDILGLVIKEDENIQS